MTTTSMRNRKHTNANTTKRCSLGLLSLWWCRKHVLIASLVAISILKSGKAETLLDATNDLYVKEVEDETGYGLLLQVEKELVFEKRSKYQLIQVHNSPKYYGKILVLDGCVQITERDGDSYNEMLAHSSMFASVVEPKRVLVIGGGDGHVVSEILKHKSVTHVDFVELDEDVIEVCKNYFEWSKVWSRDQRVSLHIMDGATFCSTTRNEKYDVIIQDSADPNYLDEHGNLVTLPSEALFTRDHFSNLYNLLSDEGVLLFQAESYNIPSYLEHVKEFRSTLLEVGFVSVRYGTIATSSYPTGQIGFLLCLKHDTQPNFAVIEKRFQQLSLPTTYYHPRLQASSFDLPLWVEHYIYGDDDKDSGVKEEL